MRLAAHLHGLEGHDIEDDAIGRKEHVQVALEVFFGQLVGQVAKVQAAHGVRRGDGVGEGAYVWLGMPSLEAAAATGTETATVPGAPRGAAAMLDSVGIFEKAVWGWRNVMQCEARRERLSCLEDGVKLPAENRSQANEPARGSARTHRHWPRGGAPGARRDLAPE